MPPLFLAIEGKPGEGKTSQTIGTCIQHGIDVFYMSASQLSGAHESEPLDIMEKVYRDCIKWKKDGKKVTLVIDDFHLSNAISNGDIKRTINSSLLTGFLMNLAESYGDDRVPIVLTGNNFDKIYAPLLRAGRADKFVWAPDETDKKEIIMKLYEGFVKMDSKSFDRFYKKYSNASIAEFVQLKNDYRKEILFKHLEGLIKFDEKTMKILEKKIDKETNMISFDVLEQLASQRIQKK